MTITDINIFLAIIQNHNITKTAQQLFLSQSTISHRLALLEKEIGKPVGTYITVDVPSFVNDTDIFDGRLKKISGILKNLLPSECDNVLY